MVQEKDPLAELIKAAEAGDPEAMSQLGTVLATADEKHRDLEGARRWLRAASEAGDLNAMFNLGVLYEKGLGVQADLSEAALWFWQAAEQGDSGARIKLGTMLIRGQGFATGSPVIQSVKASAEGGRPYAQTFLGKMFLDGVGLDQDDAQAESWFRKAAEQGDEGAAFNLVEMMTEGRTSETSEEELAAIFFDLGMAQLKNGNSVRAFDCLVSIKRISPRHFLAQRLENEIERANKAPSGH